MFQSRVTVHTHTILPSLCGGDTTCNVTDGGGGAASSEHTANSVGGNEASVWPLIGTQSSAGVWLSAGRGCGGGVREELERIYFFVGIVRFRLPLSEPGHWNLCVTRDPPPLSSPHRVRLGALSERLPVGGRSLRGRGRGQRQPPSQQPPPSRCARGPCRNVRGG